MQNPDTRESINAPVLYIVLNEREFWLRTMGLPQEEMWNGDEESFSGGGSYFEDNEEIFVFLSEWHRAKWVDVPLVTFLASIYIHELIHHIDMDIVERLVANAEFTLVGWIIDGTKRQG